MAEFALLAWATERRGAVFMRSCASRYTQSNNEKKSQAPRTPRRELPDKVHCDAPAFAPKARNLARRIRPFVHTFFANEVGARLVALIERCGGAVATKDLGYADERLDLRRINAPARPSDCSPQRLDRRDLPSRRVSRRQRAFMLRGLSSEKGVRRIGSVVMRPRARHVSRGPTRPFLRPSRPRHVHQLGRIGPKLTVIDVAFRGIGSAPAQS